MTQQGKPGKQVSRSSEVGNFLDKVAKTPSVTPIKGAGRLIFALDATASRENTWQDARRTQSAMFDVASRSGGLSIQLCYYQGMNSFITSPWLNDSSLLKARMEHVECLTGLTQIERLLEHALNETRIQPVNALVFIGDCIEEPGDRIRQLAGQLGVLNTRLFLFQEGHDPEAERLFMSLARLSGGAFCRFDAGSAKQLEELLAAVAAYASGGLAALESFSRHRNGLSRQLTHQVKGR